MGLRIVGTLGTSHAKCRTQREISFTFAFELTLISSVFCVKVQTKLLFVSVVSKDTFYYLLRSTFCVRNAKGVHYSGIEIVHTGIRCKREVPVRTVKNCGTKEEDALLCFVVVR